MIATLIAMCVVGCDGDDDASSDAGPDMRTSYGEDCGTDGTLFFECPRWFRDLGPGDQAVPDHGIDMGDAAVDPADIGP